MARPYDHAHRHERRRLDGLGAPSSERADGCGALSRSPDWPAASAFSSRCMVAPWPGWHAAVSKYLRPMRRASSGGEHEGREVTFEAAPGPADDTRIVIVNQALIAPDGSGPVRNSGSPSRRAGMAAAGPLPRPGPGHACAMETPPEGRDARSAPAPALFVFADQLLRSGSNPPKSASSTSAGSRAPWRRRFEEAAVSQFGLALPLLLWIVVALRREDFSTLDDAGAFRRLGGPGTAWKPN